MLQGLVCSQNKSFSEGCWRIGGAEVLQNLAEDSGFSFRDISSME